MPGVQVGATAQGLRGEHAGQLVVLIPGEGEVGHHRRAGVVHGQVPGPGLVDDPVAERGSAAVHRLDGFFVLQRCDGGDGGRHGHGGKPERAGDEDVCRAVAERVVAEHGGEGPAVRDRLAPGRQVRVHPDRLPAGPEVQPEPGSDVVQDQRGPFFVAQGAEPAGEGGVDQLLVEAGVVLERADQDPGQVIAGLGGGPLRAGQVVEGVAAEVGVVGGRDAGRARRAPRRGAVVGALGHQDLAPPGLRPGDRAAHGGGVGAVLGEYRPVRVPDGLGEEFGQVHHDRARRVHAVAGFGLGPGRGLHFRVLVAKDDRAVAAHQVDVLVPVRVPDPRATAAPHELRVGGAGGRLVPVHPARDHGPGALAQLPVGGAVTHEVCSLLLLSLIRCP